MHSSSIHYRAALAGTFTALCLIALHLGIIVLLPDESARVTVSNLLIGLASLAVSVTALRAALAYRRQARPFFRLWLCIGLSFLMIAIGDALWIVYEQVLGIAPYPSAADIFYLLSYPFFAAGLLMLPWKFPSRQALLKTALDAVITIITAVVVYWNYIFGPTILAGTAGSWIELALAVAYPAGDLILIVGLIVALYRLPVYSGLNPLWMILVSMVVMIFTDSLFVYQTMLGTYKTAHLLDLGFTLSYTLTGLAALWFLAKFPPGKQMVTPAGKTTSRRSVPLAFLPNIWIVAAFGMLITHWQGNYPLGLEDLSIFVGSIALLVLVRQWVTVAETDQLTRELEYANRAMQLEIEERRRVQQRLWHDALHDALTGLPNRALFLDRLNHACEKNHRTRNSLNAVLFLDLDGFKVVNDSLGHLAGDQLLVITAQRLQQSVRSCDTVARLGGDEFVILLEDLQTPNEWKSIVSHIQRELAAPIHLDGQKVFISASIGVVLDAAAYERAQDVLRDADLAMYEAKSNGKARYEVFQPRMHTHALWRMSLENDLRQAVQNGEFILHYQPIFRLSTGTLAGFEALVRWQHPVRGLIAPDEFIPLAEETGLILPLGRLVLTMACRQAAIWRRAFPQLEIENTCVRVNISGVQLSQPDFVEQIAAVLTESGLPSQALALEVTETSALQDLENTGEKLRALHRLGVRTEIDDFGMGYSSLSYLQKLPVQAIKIDRFFIHNITHRDRLPDLMHMILLLARSLGIEAVAEGVETALQLEVLRKFGCDYAQGFLFSLPLTAAEVAQFLSQPVPAV